MRNRKTKLRHLTALAAVAILATSCGDSPTEPDDEVNPELIAALEAAGMGVSSSGELEQGSALFIGPDGMPMDATAKEFFQQLTWDDGVVWRTSGIVIAAVPDESVSDPPIRRLSIGVGFPGSLSSVGPGTYELVTEFPPIDFTTPNLFAYVRYTEGELRVENGTHNWITASGGGSVTIESVQYFSDVYDCPLYSASDIVGESCEYQIGLLSGSVEFSGMLADGTPIDLPPTEFSLPIKRETITLVER